MLPTCITIIPYYCFPYPAELTASIIYCCRLARSVLKKTCNTNLKRAEAPQAERPSSRWLPPFILSRERNDGGDPRPPPPPAGPATPQGFLVPHFFFVYSNFQSHKGNRSLSHKLKRAQFIQRQRAAVADGAEHLPVICATHTDRILIWVSQIPPTKN